MLVPPGPVFLAHRAELEDVYKVYCQNHDEAIALLEAYEKDERIQRHLLDFLETLRWEPPASSCPALRPLFWRHLPVLQAETETPTSH